MGDALVARPAHERVLRELEAQQHAGRRERTWAVIRRPSALASSIWDISSRQPLGRSGCSADDGDGPGRFLRQPAEQVDLAVLILEVRHDLHPAGAGLAHGVGDRGQLGFLGAQGRDAPAVGGAVIERARGREAERAGAQPFGGRAAPSRRCPARSPARDWRRARPSHRRAARACGTWARDVDVVGTAAAIASRKFGKLSQFHGRPSLSTTLGDVLDAFHQVDQHVVLGLARHGAKPTPQLPRRTVVTPFQMTGDRRSLQVTCAS